MAKKKKKETKARKLFRIGQAVGRVICFVIIIGVGGASSINDYFF
jgi:hypothetical protein